jgi:hypothetical protein
VILVSGPTPEQIIHLMAWGVSSLGDQEVAVRVATDRDLITTPGARVPVWSSGAGSS